MNTNITRAPDIHLSKTPGGSIATRLISSLASKTISRLLLLIIIAVSSRNLKAEGWDSIFNNTVVTSSDLSIGDICSVQGVLYVALNDYTGPTPTASILKYSSGTWVTVPNSTVGGVINALSGVVGLTTSTKLFVGGSFWYVGTGTNSITANNIAALESPASSTPVWHSLTSGGSEGTDGPVYALRSINYFTSSVEGCMVYVGGNFTTAGQYTTYSIARWSGFGNGIGWESVGGGVDSGGTVFGIDLHYYSGATTVIDQVYLTGIFTKTIGVSPVNWCFATLGSGGTSWINVGRGIGGTSQTDYPDCTAYWSSYDWAGHSVVLFGAGAYIGGFFYGIEDKLGGFTAGTDYFPAYCTPGSLGCSDCGDSGFYEIGAALYNSSSGLLSSSSGLINYDEIWTMSVKGTLFQAGNSGAAKLVSGAWSALSGGAGSLPAGGYKSCTDTGAIYFADTSGVYRYVYP